MKRVSCGTRSFFESRFPFDLGSLFLSGENGDIIRATGLCEQLQMQNKTVTAGVHVELLFTLRFRFTA